MTSGASSSHRSGGVWGLPAVPAHSVQFHFYIPKSKITRPRWALPSEQCANKDPEDPPPPHVCVPVRRWIQINVCVCVDDSKHTEHMNTYNSIKGTNTEECNESLLHPDIWRWNDAAQIIITSRCTSLFCFFILLTLGNKYEESNPRIRIYSRLALLIVWM